MPTAVVLGTRPEIIKMAPVIGALDEAGDDPWVVHTGQHYSHEMDRVFFDNLGLAAPRTNLEVGSGTHGVQTARLIERLERVFQAERPDAVLVQGDTNTVLAGALVAAKLHIPLGHVEGGLRSFDRRMPEEVNRIVADHLASWLFAPTDAAGALLRREGIDEHRIHVTGNTIVDAVQAMAVRARAESRIHERLGVDAHRYVLLTAHRQENVDDPERFAGLLQGAARAAEALDLPIVYPIHPRARKMLEAFDLDPGIVRLVPPADFLDFVALEADARLVLTDSGGVQEETCILRVPCVTLRENTERPETIGVGSNQLAGTDPDAIEAAARHMAAVATDWENPFGDGQAGRRIARIVLDGAPDDKPTTSRKPSP